MPTIAWGKSSGADVTLPWQGNCTVENCRVLRAGEPDDDIALAFSEFAPDSDTRLLYHFNEAGGVSVQDSSPYGNHGTLVGPRVGFDTGSAWLGASCIRHYEDTDPGSSYWRCSHSASLVGMAALTLEAWIRGDNWHYLEGAYRNPCVIDKPYSYSLVLGDWGLGIGGLLWINNARYTWNGGRIVGEPNTWTHVAVVWDAGYVNVYVNGTRRYQAFTATGTITGTGDLQGMHGGVFMCDELRVSSVARYTADFSPHRYEGGSVVARCELPAPHRLNSIDWGGNLGADYGRVRRVYVRQGQDWVAVGEEYPSPPLAGIGRIVRGPEIVKVELEPKQDAMQSETPVLDWLAVEVVPLETPPKRRIDARLNRGRVAAQSGSTIAAQAARITVSARSG